MTQNEKIVATCEQLIRLAKIVDTIERSLDPEGPGGWELRETTKVIQSLHELLEEWKT